MAPMSTSALRAALSPFYTATRPLSDWLNADNFSYHLDDNHKDSVQWGKAEIEGLLKSVHEVYISKSSPSKCPLSIKISELLLLEHPPSTATEVGEFIDRLNQRNHFEGHPWYLHRPTITHERISEQDENGSPVAVSSSNSPLRQVEVLVGRHRLATLLSIYAVLQYQLQHNVDILSNNSRKTLAVVEEAKSIINTLHSRFTHRCVVRGVLGVKPMLVSDDDIIDVFTFPSTVTYKNDALYKILDNASCICESNTSSLVSTAVTVNRWFIGSVLNESKPEMNIKTLLGWLNILDKDVLCTATLITRPELAPFTNKW